MAGQIVDYTSLCAALEDWSERSYDPSTLAMLVGLAEAEFRLELGPSYARETSSTLTFVAGTATLPAGFIRPLALTHATYGPLRSAGIGAIRQKRILDTSGIPTIYAITGTRVEVASSYDGDLDFDFEATLTALSDSNQANWLLLTAPQAYLSMCMSMAKAREEDYGNAAMYRQAALSTLGALGIQSMVAQYGTGAARISGMTP